MPVLVLVLTDCATTSHTAPIFRHGAMRVQQHSLGGIRYFEATAFEDDPRTPMPMVVFLHGRASSPDLPRGPVVDVPFAYRAIFPEAPMKDGAGYSWFTASGARGESRALAEGLIVRGEQLAQFIEALSLRHPQRGKPIVAGFSQGGELTLTLALHHPEVMSTALPLSGYIPPSILPARPDPTRSYPRIRALHGSEDPILQVHRTRAAVELLQRRGFDVELREIPDARHEVSPRMRLVWHRWLQSALFHAWRSA